MPKNEKKGKRAKFLDELVSFLQSKGFLWGPFPEIYGGFSGFYSYGPLGKLLKNKVEDTLRKTFQSNGFWEVECPIVLPDIVWKASGHLDTFVDRTVSCKKCNGAFTADKLIEEKYDVSADAFSDQQLLNFINEKKIRCPACGGEFNYDIKKQSLMMKTWVNDIDASLRPETATVTYLPFKRYYEFFRKKLPICVYQIGKAFRNEISPRQHVLRSREFTQAESQLFIDPIFKNKWDKYNEIKKEKLPFWSHEVQKKNKKVEVISVEAAMKKKYLQTKSYAWNVWLAYKHFENMGFPKDRMRLRQHHPDERAFYADDAWDIEVNFDSFGWVECCGVHERMDYDLVQHEKFSKENLQATREDGKKVTPHIIEMAFGIDRMVFGLLDSFYDKKDVKDGKTTLKVPYHLAPVDVAIFPLLKKDKLPEKAMKVKEKLEREFVVEYDAGGSIGRRYLRAAEAGTAYCVTIDHDSLKKDDVTLRDRDTGKQIRIKIKELNEKLRGLISGEISFKDLGR